MAQPKKAAPRPYQKARQTLPPVCTAGHAKRHDSVKESPVLKSNTGETSISLEQKNRLMSSLDIQKKRPLEPMVDPEVGTQPGDPKDLGGCSAQGCSMMG